MATAAAVAAVCLPLGLAAGCEKARQEAGKLIDKSKEKILDEGDKFTRELQKIRKDRYDQVDSIVRQ